MIDTEITALAREYAKDEAKGTAVESLPDGFKENVIQRNADHFEKHLRWLTRRYCLVEKSKIREAYRDAQKDQYNSERDFALTLAGRNRSAVLIDLFPEIGKEVES